MSAGLRPQSASAFSAASACSWIPDMVGMRPISVVAAAPTTATLFCFMGSGSRRLEEGERLGPEIGELQFYRHVEPQRLRRLRAIDDVGHHPDALVELDHGDRVRLGPHVGTRAVVDHVAVEPALAGGLEHLDVARAAGRAERAGREIGLRTFGAALQQELAGLAAVPEMLGLRRGLRENTVHGNESPSSFEENAAPFWRVRLPLSSG